jgi:adenine-specific DNA-methyltransferase
MNHLTKYARLLRKNMTREERILWHNLRSRMFLGYKFRRQEPIGEYIVDFHCYEKKLIIELDGGQHAQDNFVLNDAKRDENLVKAGFRILRFWNNEVTDNLNGVLMVIKHALETPSPSSSP